MIDDLSSAGDDPDGWPSESAEAEERTPLFANPEQFVVSFLSPLVCRRLGGSYTWCAQWWKHTEAVLRITAMWETWEYYRYEGALGMSTWLLHHADPHLAVLLSRDGGPFSNCKPDRHSPMPPLPSDPAPDGLWAAAAFSDPATS